MPKSWSLIPSLIKGTRKGLGEMADSRIGARGIRVSTKHFIVLESKEKKAKIPQCWAYAKGAQKPTGQSWNI